MTEEVVVRRANLKDIPAMLALIIAYAANQIMLPRTEFDLAENIRDFVVAYAGGQLLGCGALHFYTPTSAEVLVSGTATSNPPLVWGS